MNCDQNFRKIQYLPPQVGRDQIFDSLLDFQSYTKELSMQKGSQGFSLDVLQVNSM